MSFTFSIPQHILELPKGTKDGDLIDWTDNKVKERAEHMLSVNLSQELNIVPNDIFKYIRVSLGQRVADGEVIAEKKTFFTAHLVKAPIEAEVRAINHTEGTLILVGEHVVEVPFVMKAKFKGMDKDLYQFQASAGLSSETSTVMSRTFGGLCSYINNADDVTIEACENRVVVTPLSGKMILSKIVALGPMALVTYKADYHQLDVPQLMIKSKSDWDDILEKLLPMALFIEGSSALHFYKP